MTIKNGGWLLSFEALPIWAITNTMKPIRNGRNKKQLLYPKTTVTVRPSFDVNLEWYLQCTKRLYASQRSLFSK